MKINKKPGIAEKRLIAALIVVVALLVFLVPTVNAYTYNGYKWTFGTADWRFSSDFPDGYEQSVKNAANTWSNAGSAFTFKQFSRFCNVSCLGSLRELTLFVLSCINSLPLFSSGLPTF